MKKLFAWGGYVIPLIFVLFITACSKNDNGYTLVPNPTPVPTGFPAVITINKPEMAFVGGTLNFSYSIKDAKPGTAVYNGTSIPMDGVIQISNVSKDTVVSITAVGTDGNSVTISQAGNVFSATTSLLCNTPGGAKWIHTMSKLVNASGVTIGVYPPHVGPTTFLSNKRFHVYSPDAWGDWDFFGSDETKLFWGGYVSVNPAVKLYWDIDELSAHRLVRSHDNGDGTRTVDIFEC